LQQPELHSLHVLKQEVAYITLERYVVEQLKITSPYNSRKKELAQ
jgi:hypothetical protein